MDNLSKYYNKLNHDQKKAVDIIDGPLLVLAGPGTGKTELLSVRAANIINKKNIRAENILILTYTNAAAKAMKERLAKILGNSGYDVETGTFHSFANSIILESEEAANYIQERIQITDIEKIKLIEYILDHTDGIDALRPFRAPYLYRSKIENRISELKKEGVSPKKFESFINSLKPDNIFIEDKHMPRLKALAVIYKLYEEYKSGKNRDLFDERGRYDFDDMIICAVSALKHERELKESLIRQYSYVMVDEYQDTNGAQLDLLFELVDVKNPNLCCVGDDDQSIYRFQGASIGNFKILKEKFPKIPTVSLRNNYRSTNDIIDLSGRIIKHLPDSERVSSKDLTPCCDYKSKAIEFHEFTTETEELLFITEKVKELKSLIECSEELSADEKKSPYNNIAVLLRKRDDILKVVDAFLKAGIPYATDGKEDIASEKRVRQMIDVLNLAYFKDVTDLAYKDAVFYRVVTSDYFKIPLNDILNFIRYVRQKKHLQKEQAQAGDITLFCEFIDAFEIKDKNLPPDAKQTQDLSIAGSKQYNFKDLNAMHNAAWVIKRLMESANTDPVHSILMRYIDDAGVYRFILKLYDDNKILRIRDLRALSSFVNMVKDSDLNNPALNLADFIDEIETRAEHKMSLTGSLVTMTQEGVKIFTAHGSKGLEFHSVIIPFCLQNKNWPVKPKADMIPLPPEIYKAKEKAKEKAALRELSFYDETRLFYVASTRAKSQLIYTASPTESAISSSYLSSAGLYSVESESQVSEEDLMGRSVSKSAMEDPFTGTEPVLKDLVANITLNPTSLNNYITCKRKFLYDNVLMLPSEKKRNLIFGTCTHKALEDAYALYMKKSEFPDFEFFKQSFIRQLNYEGPEKSIKEHCLRQLLTLKDWFLKASLNPVMPISLEKKLAIVVSDGCIFTGKYDKTELVNASKRLVKVVDYKTGKPDEHIKKISSGVRDLASDECDTYLRQLIAYKFLFDRDKKQNKGFSVSKGELVFVEPANSSVIKYSLKKGEFINCEIDITDEMVEQLEEVIRGCFCSIHNLDFEKLPEPDDDVTRCGGCGYKNICWR